MVEQKEVLEKKLETVKKQLTYNTILGVIAILVLVFVPWIQFENFMFKISLENIIAFIVLIVCIVRGFSLRSKKEELEAELSVYEEKENLGDEQTKEAVLKLEKYVINLRKEGLPEKQIYHKLLKRGLDKEILDSLVTKKQEDKFVCEYCDKNLKSEEALNKHYDSCEKKKIKEEKETRITLWIVGIIFFVALAIYFIFNNKINLIPLFLIGFIATSFFDKLFNCYKKKSNRLKHFEFNWWKKGIAILTIIFLFILINWLIPECPASCNDNNSCTNDFCSKETGYKCMNTLKLNCKGNGICESGEYGTSDCPNCDDSNKCTADSYDVGAKKCINVEMKGCIN